MVYVHALAGELNLCQYWIYNFCTMSRPVLSKEQQKHSLSGKRGSVKGLRNVLAQPQDNYWPIVDTEKCSVLEGLLNKLLPSIKRQSHLIPWSQLRHMKREERRQAKKEALLKETNVPNSDIANSIIFGINAITRSLEKNNISCMLIDANIQPPFLVKHIIHMAQNKIVPILLLPKLKDVILFTVGFASAACALKNIVAESSDHPFHPLYITVFDIFKNIPLPTNTFQLCKPDKISEQTVPCERDEICFENDSVVDPTEPIKFTLSTDVYMYRSSCKERAFVPPGVTESTIVKDSSVSEKTDQDFISLSNYDSDVCNIKRSSRYMDFRENKDSGKQKNSAEFKNAFADVKYLPLKVKRLQGNANREKATKIRKQKKK